MRPNATKRGLAAAGAVAFVSALAAIKFYNPATAGIFPPCPFHALTGWHCPGCGGTRGVHALLNGDAAKALDFNVLLVVFVPLMLFAFVSLVLLAVRGRGISIPKSTPPALVALLILLLAFGVLRNLPFYPFNVLAP